MPVASIGFEKIKDQKIEIVSIIMKKLTMS